MVGHSGARGRDDVGPRRGPALTTGRSWAGAVADFLLPPACPACEGPADRTAPAGVCLECRLALKPPPPPLCPRCGTMLGSGGAGRFCLECAEWPEVLDCARSCYLHQDPASTLVWRFKYGGWQGLAGFMAPCLERSARAARIEPDLVTWVPTTAWRRRSRGYDQAEILAREVSKRLGVPSMAALRRRRGGRTQVVLQPAGRLSNVRRAFTLREEASSRLAGAHVLLVDDVLTTGATAVAAASAVGEAGVRSVRALTFARATPLRRTRGDA